MPLANRLRKETQGSGNCPLRMRSDVISARLAAAMARRGLHYGWVVVASTLSHHAGDGGGRVSSGRIAAAAAARVRLVNGGDILCTGSAAAVVRAHGSLCGGIHRCYGVRNVTFSSLCLIGSGLILSLGMTHLWQMVVLWGVIVGLGTGLTDRKSVV